MSNTQTVQQEAQPAFQALQHTQTFKSIKSLPAMERLANAFGASLQSKNAVVRLGAKVADINLTVASRVTEFLVNSTMSPSTVSTLDNRLTTLLNSQAQHSADTEAKDADTDSNSNSNSNSNNSNASGSRMTGSPGATSSPQQKNGSSALSLRIPNALNIDAIRSYAYAQYDVARAKLPVESVKSVVVSSHDALLNAAKRVARVPIVQSTIERLYEQPRLESLLNTTSEYAKYVDNKFLEFVKPASAAEEASPSEGEGEEEEEEEIVEEVKQVLTVVDKYQEPHSYKEAVLESPTVVKNHRVIQKFLKEHEK